MPHVPNGMETPRPFVPARDFELSKRFYEALGFEMLLDSEIAIFKVGSGSFVLQNYWQKEWAENFMMQLVVDDLDAWWAHIAALELPARFGVRAPSAPALQPWGVRVAYVFDPAGALWHFSERRPGVIHD